jgi:hypothetical protein
MGSRIMFPPPLPGDNTMEFLKNCGIFAIVALTGLLIGQFLLFAYMTKLNRKMDELLDWAKPFGYDPKGNEDQPLEIERTEYHPNNSIGTLPESHTEAIIPIRPYHPDHSIEFPRIRKVRVNENANDSYRSSVQ